MPRALLPRQANDIYLKLAIGNAPWPIGVTSVGIHERSAREKISHVMNASGAAHIMNDEATRKYFQVRGAVRALVRGDGRMYVCMHTAGVCGGGTLWRTWTACICLCTPRACMVARAHVCFSTSLHKAVSRSVTSPKASLH